MLHMTRKMQNQTHAQELVALRTGRSVEENLRDLYVKRGLTMAEVAAELGVSRLTIAMWLREFQVERLSA